MTVQELERVSAPPRVREDAREEQARILEAAALEIEVRGHAKAVLIDEETGAVCAGGAIACARGWDGEKPYQLWDTLLRDREQFFADYNDLPAFNNAAATAPGEVTFLLRWRAEEIRDGR